MDTLSTVDVTPNRIISPQPQQAVTSYIHDQQLKNTKRNSAKSFETVLDT